MSIRRRRLISRDCCWVEELGESSEEAGRRVEAGGAGGRGSRREVVVVVRLLSSLVTPTSNWFRLICTAWSLWVFSAVLCAVCTGSVTGELQRQLLQRL